MDGQLVPRVESPRATRDDPPVDEESADREDAGEFGIPLTDFVEQARDADTPGRDGPMELAVAYGFARGGEQQDTNGPAHGATATVPAATLRLGPTDSGRPVAAE
jgi:hypothetical protein